MQSKTIENPQLNQCRHNYKPSSNLYEVLRDFKESDSVTILVYQSSYCPRCYDKKDYFLFERTLFNSQSVQINKLIQGLNERGFQEVKK